MKIGAFYLTYKRAEMLGSSIDLLRNQTRPPELIAVIDNGSCDQTRKVVERYPAAEVVYVDTGDNLGSAGGTAFGAQWLYDHGYDWIYFGDDDNPPATPDTIERLMNLAEDADDFGGMGAVGARWDWTKGEMIRFRDEELIGPTEVDFIGGGQQLLVHRRVVDKVGVPNPKLFFGYPDLEYALRIRKAGFRLKIDGRLHLDYRTMSNRRNLQSKRALLPRRPLRSIWRNYYTTRNYIFMMKNTFQRPDLARREAYKAVGRIVTSWFKGPSYGAAFSRLQWAGICDGYSGRIGRTVDPRIHADA